jgi:hypothetical protein
MRNTLGTTKISKLPSNYYNNNFLPSLGEGGGCLCEVVIVVTKLHEQASLDSCTGLFLRALHAFRKSVIHLFSYT